MALSCLWLMNGCGSVTANSKQSSDNGQAQLSVGQSAINFGNVLVGSKDTVNLTLTNAGATGLTVSGIAVTGANFAVSGVTTPLTIATGQTVQVSVTFSPTAAGSATGSVSIASSDPAHPAFTVPLTGTASTEGLTITPSSASFGNVVLGAPSTQTFRLMNSGTGPLSITQISVTGKGFSTGTLRLPMALSAGQASNFNVEFAPAATGAVTGSVSVVSNAGSSPAKIALSGTGVAPIRTLSFNTTNVTFGNVNVGSSAFREVIVTNTGNVNTQISQITQSGTAFELSGVSTPVTINASQSLTIRVNFYPEAVAAMKGTMTVTSDANGSPATISVAGTGVQPTSHTVSLNWLASDATVSGYNVYRSTTDGSNYVKITASPVTTPSYVDSSVVRGTTYYYVTTAVDASGDESAYSNQASAAVP